MTASWVGDLVVKLVSEDGEGNALWELAEDFGMVSVEAGCTIVAKKGERTDFASIPRAPLVYLAEGDKGHRASVIHDHLYQESPHTMNRLLADKVLREGLILEGMSEEEANAWFVAVRFGGGGHWDANLSVTHVSPQVPLLP